MRVFLTSSGAGLKAEAEATGDVVLARALVAVGELLPGGAAAAGPLAVSVRVEDRCVSVLIKAVKEVG